MHEVQYGNNDKNDENVFQTKNPRNVEGEGCTTVGFKSANRDKGDE